MSSVTSPEALSVKGEARRLSGLAVPVIFTQLATMLMGIVDTLMVARLGTQALGAVTLGNVWSFGLQVLGIGVLLGLDPIVAQAHGAGDGARAGRALQRGLVLSLGLAVPLAVPLALTGDALRLFRQAPAIADLAHAYTIMQIPAIPFFLGYMAIRQYLSGRGIMAPAMWVAWFANLFNVVANWALIYGHLGFEPRGVVGAGIATSLSRLFLFLGLVAWVWWRKLHRGAWPRWSRAALSLAGLAEILRYGVPTGLQIGLEVWAFHVSTLLAGRLGAEPLAAHAIALQLASFSFMVPLGISIAAAARVGNLVGARDLARARVAGFVALGLGASVMACFGITFLLGRQALPRLWDAAPGVLALAASVLPIAAAFQVFDGTQVVGCGILRGHGDTRPAAIFNFFGYWLLALPLGYLLAFPLGLGIRGLWWGLTLGLSAVAVLLVARVRFISRV